MIEIRELTVQFGAVRSLNEVTFEFPMGTCGLIGPNGAGKTTFFNALSGFVKPKTGSVRVFGTELVGMRAYRRARWGVRRTFQTEQAIQELSVFDNVRMVHEQSASGGKGRIAAIGRAIEFVGLASVANKPVGTLSAGERRLVELARAVVGSPKLVLLDEPAAGLPDEETRELSGLIRRIPEEHGALTILVDHDMDLVSSCCSTTAVLDFGRLVAVGPTSEVLRDQRVIRAYLGDEEVAS